MLIPSSWIDRFNANTNKITAGSDVGIEMLALRCTRKKKRTSEQLSHCRRSTKSESQYYSKFKTCTTASASVCASERTQKKIKGIEQGAQKYTNAHMDLASGKEKRQ